MKLTPCSSLSAALLALGLFVIGAPNARAVDAEQAVTITGVVCFENDPTTNALGVVSATVNKVRYGTRELLGLLSTNVAPTNAATGRLLLVTEAVTLTNSADPVFVVRLGSNDHVLPPHLFDLPPMGASASSYTLRTNGAVTYTANYVNAFNIYNDTTSPALMIFTSLYSTEKGASKLLLGTEVLPPGSLSASGVGEYYLNDLSGPTTIKVTLGAPKLIP
jgi:hypothetical protein